MTNYKITVAYDGTDFHGWQIQPTDVSITSTLQNAWFRLFNEQINILGASRTDAGVHALGQVARFASSTQLADDVLLKAWNAHLPSSIVVRSLEKAPVNFHPCVNVAQKTYYYVLFLHRPLPFVARYGWHYRFIHSVDLEKLSKILPLYQGTHDFGSFCKVELDDPKDTVRTIDTIQLEPIKRWGALLITIQGQSFVRFQIRRMIGYALDVARQPELPVDYIKDLLKNPNPQQNLLKAEGSGLCLRKVLYHHDN